MSSAAQVGAGPAGALGSPSPAHSAQILLPMASCHHTFTSGPPRPLSSSVDATWTTHHLLRSPTLSCPDSLPPVLNHLRLLPQPLPPALTHCLCLYASPLASIAFPLWFPTLSSSLLPTHCPSVPSLLLNAALLLLPNAASPFLPPLPSSPSTPTPHFPHSLPPPIPTSPFPHCAAVKSH